MPKSNAMPVVMYPEGVIVGKVRSGRFGGTKPRHVAFDSEGQRVGTFDSWAGARDALVALARGNG